MTIDSIDEAVDVHRSIAAVLDERERRIIYRRFWLDETYREIAEVEGVSTSRIQQITRRGLLAMANSRHLQITGGSRDPRQRLCRLGHIYVEVEPCVSV